MIERTVTLRDVAARAGVHPATASRALNPETRLLVREDTARRVLDDLARDGLIVRRSGVGTFVRAEPRRKRLTLLIFEVQEPARRQIASAFGELVGGIAEVAWEAGAALSLAYVRRPEELPRWLEEAQEGR